MTKQEALRQWREDHLPQVKAQYEADGVPDYPARSENWNAFTDALCKSRQITLLSLIHI